MSPLAGLRPVRTRTLSNASSTATLEPLCPLSPQPQWPQNSGSTCHSPIANYIAKLGIEDIDINDELEDINNLIKTEVGELPSAPNFIGPVTQQLMAQYSAVSEAQPTLDNKIKVRVTLNFRAETLNFKKKKTVNFQTKTIKFQVKTS